MRRFVHSSYGRALVFTMAGILGVCLTTVFGGYFANSAFGLSSSNAVLYLVKEGGWLEFRNDLAVEEQDKLMFMMDMSRVFRFLKMFVSNVLGTPLVETTWDPETGRGVIKEFNPDGTQMLLVLSRYVSGGERAQGLFVGGTLPYGDIDRFGDEQGNNTGMAYFDGNRWIHLWCNSNEGIGASGGAIIHEPAEWDYLASRILKRTPREVMLESSHRVNLAGDPVEITRTLDFRAGDDHVTLKIQVTNVGDRPVTYDYAYGDEPWVGEFGSSAGDVGWYDGGYVIRETAIDPTRHRVAGFADLGNLDAGERDGFTGYANFIEWVDPPPTHVYFANDFERMEGRFLDSRDNRILNIVWKGVQLRPGASAAQVLRIGFLLPGQDVMARGVAPGGMPEHPQTAGNVHYGTLS